MKLTTTKELADLIKWLKFVNATYETDGAEYVAIKDVSSFVIRKNWFKIETRQFTNFFDWLENWEFIFKDDELYLKIK